MSPMRKLPNLLSTLAAVLATGAILAAVMVTVPQTPLKAQKGGGKNGPPKNLKILTPENLMPQMQTFPAALGVENQEAATSATRRTVQSTPSLRR